MKNVTERPGTCDAGDAKKRRIKNVFLIVGSTVTLGMVYLAIFRFLNIGIPCNFHRITGLLCPGCGMTRAVFALFRFDFKAAFSLNALSLTLIPLGCLYGGFRAYKYIVFDNYKTRLWEYFLWAGFAMGIVVFTVFRNLI